MTSVRRKKEKREKGMKCQGVHVQSPILNNKNVEAHLG